MAVKYTSSELKNLPDKQAKRIRKSRSAVRKKSCKGNKVRSPRTGRCRSPEGVTRSARRIRRKIAAGSLYRPRRSDARKLTSTKKKSRARRYRKAIAVSRGRKSMGSAYKRRSSIRKMSGPERKARKNMLANRRYKSKKV
jgi:hypothetical protein